MKKNNQDNQQEQKIIQTNKRHMEEIDIDDNKYKELSVMLEAILLASNRAMTVEDLLAIFDSLNRPEKTDVLAAIALLQQNNVERGIDLIKTANGYQFVTKKQYSHLVSNLWQEKPVKYSRALLETLALVAYRQPITRGEIEQIRGVSISQNIFKTLQEDRGWIKVVGYKEVPGKPSLYATTKDFLTYFGLESLDQLPPLPQIIDFINNEDKSETVNN